MNFEEYLLRFLLEASKKEEEGEAHAEAEMLANVNRTFRAQQKLKKAGWPPHETTEAEYDQEERSTQRAMRRANARGVGTGYPPARGIYAQRAQLNKLKKGSKAYNQPKPTAYRRKRDMEGGWPPAGNR